MPTRAKKINRIAVVGLFFSIFSLAIYAQSSAPSTPPPSNDPISSPVSSGATSTPSISGTVPATSSAAAPSSTGATDSSTSSALDYLFNHKAQDGSVAKEGMQANEQAKTDAMAQDAMGNRQIEDPEERARFERYLGMNEVPQGDLKTYSDDINIVIDLLHQRKTTEAWQKLYQLAKYQSIDAGVSWELANRIESIWNADQTKNLIAQQNNQLQHEADTDNRNADMDSDDVKDKEIEYQRRLQDATRKPSSSNLAQNNGGTPQVNVNPGSQGQGDGGGSGTSMSPPSDEIMGKLQLTQEYLNSLQAQAKMKLNDLKVEKLFDQAKQDFADYITTLYKSGRYQHVLIAADFWRQIFDEGDYPVSMAQQVNASLEVNEEVITTIGVFNNNLDQKDVVAATDSLQQAFMLSELNPAILGVPLVKKKPIQAFSRELSRMQNIIEARDFADLEPLLAEIKQTAPDFDSVKAMSIVNAVKLESQLHLGKAKIAAQQGDLKTAMDEFQSAGEAWPGNPDLKDKALSFFNSQDVQNQSLEEFDRLVAENNYRAIFDKQLAFAPAMKDDAKRQEQLKSALEKVKIAETAIEKATLMQSNGDVYGAWETVQLAIKDLPDDNKLNNMRADLAGKGADFVSAINKAEDAESKQELGFSLSWYAVAQRAYPASEIANKAIDRLSKAILAKSSL
jgi:hypothetical protein